MSMNTLGFRKNAVLALDGGGYRIVMVTRALMCLESYVGVPLRDLFQVVVGTSAGALVAAAIACGIPAAKIHELVIEHGPAIFRPRRGWPIATRWRYDATTLERVLEMSFGDQCMGDITDIRLVITALDPTTGRTLFIKSQKPKYAHWRVVDAVRASCAIPALFSPMKRLIDGGIGGWNNAVMLGAVQAQLEGYEPSTVSLISLGTGEAPTGVGDDVGRLWAWQWLFPLLRLMLAGPGAQQIYLVQTLYPDLDLRRYQLQIPMIGFDAVGRTDELIGYGNQLWAALHAAG